MIDEWELIPSQDFVKITILKSHRVIEYPKDIVVKIKRCGIYCERKNCFCGKKKSWNVK